MKKIYIPYLVGFLFITPSFGFITEEEQEEQQRGSYIRCENAENHACTVKDLYLKNHSSVHILHRSGAFLSEFQSRRLPADQLSFEKDQNDEMPGASFYTVRRNGTKVGEVAYTPNTTYRILQFGNTNPDKLDAYGNLDDTFEADKWYNQHTDTVFFPEKLR